MTLQIYKDTTYEHILNDIYKTFYFLSNLRKIKVDYTYTNSGSDTEKIVSSLFKRCIIVTDGNQIYDPLQHILELDNVGLLLSDNDILEQIISLLLYLYELLTSDLTISNFTTDKEKMALVKIIISNNSDTTENLLYTSVLLNHITKIINTTCNGYVDAWDYFKSETAREAFKNNPDFFIDIFDKTKFDLKSMNENLKKIYLFFKNCNDDVSETDIDNVFQKLKSMSDIHGGKKISKSKKIIKKLKKYIK